MFNYLFLFKSFTYKRTENLYFFSISPFFINFFRNFSLSPSHYPHQSQKIFFLLKTYIFPISSLNLSDGSFYLFGNQLSLDEKFQPAESKLKCSRRIWILKSFLNYQVECSLNILGKVNNPRKVWRSGQTESLAVFSA